MENLHETISIVWKEEKLEDFPDIQKWGSQESRKLTGLSIAILHRLENYLSEIISEYQCGFMKGRSITDHIFTFRQVMKKFYEHDKDLHMVFIDFQQAYDSIIRNRLWSALI